MSYTVHFCVHLFLQNFFYFHLNLSPGYYLLLETSSIWWHFYTAFVNRNGENFVKISLQTTEKQLNGSAPDYIVSMKWGCGFKSQVLFVLKLIFLKSLLPGIPHL